MAEKQALSKKQLLLHSLTSLFDQGILSVLNLLVGLLLMRWIPKEEYGIYAQLFVVGLFAATLIEAFITNPLTTIAPGKPAREKLALFRHLHILQRWLSLALAILFGIGAAIALILTHSHVSPWLIGCAFSMYVFFNAQREFLRSVNFIQAKPIRVLFIDGIYALTVIIGAGILVLTNNVSIISALLLLGCANILSMVTGTGTIPHSKLPLLPRDILISDIWKRARWAAPGALVAWLTNYSYLFMTAAFIGAAASADLNASRLLLMPISLCVLAWSRVARPMASKMYANKDWKQLNHIAWISVIGIEILTAAYITVLWLAFPLLQEYVLGPQYANTHGLVLAWGIYFAINAARWVGFSWLASNDQYKQLLFASFITFFAMIASCLVLIPRFGTLGAIGALAIVEIVDLLLIWLVLLPLAKRSRT